MARSSSNKGINKNKTNGSSYSTGRNPGGMVAGLTADNRWLTTSWQFTSSANTTSNKFITSGCFCWY